MMLPQCTGMSMLLPMTTARPLLARMKLVMVTRHPDPTVLLFPMDALKLSTTMSMMPTLAMLLMFPMKE